MNLITLTIRSGFLAGSLLIFTSLTPAQQSGSVAFTRLYTGSDGQTHAERTEVRFVPRADGIELSPLVKATGFFYLKLPAGHVQEWHPAPRRQYVIALSGRNEIELADGEKIPMEPGSVILAEDITGKGHLVPLLRSAGLYRGGGPVGGVKNGASQNLTLLQRLKFYRI